MVWLLVVKICKSSLGCIENMFLTSNEDISVTELCWFYSPSQEQICVPHDIFDEKGISRVAITVAALVAIGTNPKQSAVWQLCELLRAVACLLIMLVLLVTATELMGLPVYPYRWIYFFSHHSSSFLFPVYFSC